jgi:hypothetical protein
VNSAEDYIKLSSQALTPKGTLRRRDVGLVHLYDPHVKAMPPTTDGRCTSMSY